MVEVALVVLAIIAVALGAAILIMSKQGENDQMKKLDPSTPAATFTSVAAYSQPPPDDNDDEFRYVRGDDGTVSHYVVNLRPPVRRFEHKAFPELVTHWDRGVVAPSNAELPCRVNPRGDNTTHCGYRSAGVLAM